MNVAALSGRFTAEPELRKTNNNTSVTSFTIAVDPNYVKSGEEKKANFIECVAWEKTADFICKYFHKGTMIAITGEIQTRNWEDKNGNKRKTTEILVSKADFCEPKTKTEVAPAAPEYYEVPDDDDGRLPF